MSGLQGLLDSLTSQGYRVLPEVEAHILANRNGFIGISVQYETGTHRMAAHSIGDGVQPGDVRATIVSLILRGEFRETGIDGNTRLFSLR